MKQPGEEPPRSATTAPANHLQYLCFLSAAGVWYGLELERAIGKHEVRPTRSCMLLCCSQPRRGVCQPQCHHLPVPPSFAIRHAQGTVLGVTYFVAPRKHGTFVRRENLSLYDQEVEASVRVQGALRMSIARRRARNELTQRAFNALDADEEVRDCSCALRCGRPWPQ